MKLKIGLICISMILICGCFPKDYENTHLQNENRIEIEFWYGLSGYHETVMEDLINRFNESQDDVLFKGLHSQIILRQPML